ncbi:peroxisomal membrane protein PEX14-like isoform X3 [Lotus japonicus]|uniref:peroxisomal membrane protein PEX14-like isoform X3 n=1 Tax=Lotus japonicus TaxID=34305 RepID=UPI00258FF9AA|nr:peroxisomal membrane protein PEX14-like isoform X3 [Lotus japonicus]
MATQSPSGQTTGIGGEIVQPANVDQHSSDSVTSVFVNSEPIREDQVQNAVKFLSHPKVRGSPVIHRRTFLERKGLSKEEIDEAFRRVPDSPPSVQTQDGQLNSSSNIQQQGQPQALQPAVSASTAVTTSRGILSWYSFHWSHALVTVGFLVTSCAGTTILIKKSVLPRLKSWIRNVVFEEDYGQLKKNNSKPSLAEEVAHAAKAAAAAAAEMAKASQEMLSSKSEEKRYFVEVVSLLDKQVQEMKVMTNAIRRLEASGGHSLSKIDDYQVAQTSSKQLIANGKEDYELRSGKTSLAPASVEPSNAPHPKSYMEIMAMIQRGEKPSNIRDIDDSPPNPYQQPSNPRLAPRAKPWEVNQVQTNSTQVLQSQVNGKEFKIPESWSQTKNVRITETDNVIEYNGAPAASSQQPVQRVWVPPQPPPVAMSAAAEAIRRPKPIVPKESMTADQPVTHSADISDGVEIISKSKSEGAIESIRVNSLVSSGEIQGLNHEEQ